MNFQKCVTEKHQKNINMWQRNVNGYTRGVREEGLTVYTNKSVDIGEQIFDILLLK